MESTPSTRMQQVLRRIIEGFSDYFVSCVENTYKKTPSSVEVKDITVEKKLGATGIHIVKVKLESDLGMDEASIAVKIYEASNIALDLVKKINTLESRLSPYKAQGISSVGVIFFSRGVVVMEGIQGDVFRDSRIPRPQKYRYAGRSIAAFHGYKSNRCWFEKYKLLISRSIESMPIDQNKKSSLNDIFNRRIRTVEDISKDSGSVTFGDFHPGNVIFDLRIGRNPMIHTHLIDPEYLDTTTEHDRLEDICNFFAVEAVDIYRQNQNLTRLKLNMNSFLAGYNEILALKHHSLNSYYTGNYVPLHFHMAIMILMSILNILNMTDFFGGESGLENEINMRIKLIEIFLNWTTFPD